MRNVPSRRCNIQEGRTSGVDMDSATAETSTGLLEGFVGELRDGGVLENLRAGLIGENAEVPGPFGRHRMVYADYAASGRALMQVERFVLDRVLPYYANSHTEASFCGSLMTRLRREARMAVASCCGCGPEHAVIFGGSGATAGLNRLVGLLGVRDVLAAGGKVRVILGPYEHHSNILPWRESGAEVVEVAETGGGGPDYGALDRALSESAGAALTICSFSAASNVTGILTDVVEVTRRAKRAGARMVWDYAGAGAYLPIAMIPAEGCEIDAIVVSPHKFIGGPAASGTLMVRRDIVRGSKPTWPGGGTVRFVSPWAHDYSGNIETREEAGTPNVVGDIRAALAFLVKEAMGRDFLARRNKELAERALRRLSGIERLELLGLSEARGLPIFSFRIGDGAGGHVHQQLVTRLLSDRFGIQARGGCACAGPYVHRLLGIDADLSGRIHDAILAGDEMVKPGFTRFNLSVLASDEKVDFILDSIAALAADAADFAGRYEADATRAIFFPKAGSAPDGATGRRGKARMAHA